MAELVSAEEGIEKGRGPHVDGLYVGVWGSWAYLKQAPSESLSMAAFFCGWRSYPPPYGGGKGRERVAGLDMDREEDLRYRKRRRGSL